MQLRDMAALAATFACVSMAHADSIVLEYTGISGGLGVNVTGQGGYSAGHMNHSIYDSVGGSVIGSFQTFCIEMGEYANNGESTYQIVDLTDAPDPDGGSPYSQAQADGIIDVVTKAISLGWIDTNLQTTGGTSAEISAIQASIWGAIFSGATSGNTDVQTAISDLSTETLDAGLRNTMANRLRAVVASGEQDMLYVVPLPPAAFAGLGLLGGLAGVRMIRRR